MVECIGIDIGQCESVGAGLGEQVGDDWGMIDHHPLLHYDSCCLFADMECGGCGSQRESFGDVSYGSNMKAEGGLLFHDLAVTWDPRLCKVRNGLCFISLQRLHVDNGVLFFEVCRCIRFTNISIKENNRSRSISIVPEIMMNLRPSQIFVVQHT